MSYASQVNLALSKSIESYIKSVAKECGISEKKLKNLWDKGVQQTEEHVETPPISNTALDEDSLNRLTRAELHAACKEKGLKVTGTKGVLINRLLGREETTSKTTPTKRSTKKSTATPKPKKSAQPKAPTVLKKITEHIETKNVRRNQHGNYEDFQTHFVFDSVTQKVIGRQHDDGSIIPLTEEDINLCNKFRYTYEIPENIDHDKEVVEEVEEVIETLTDIEEMVASEESELELLSDSDEN